MFSSKKMDAASKHFKKLEESFRKETRAARDYANEMSEKNSELVEMMIKVSEENAILKAENQMLKETIGLTDEELEKLLKTSKNLESLKTLLDVSASFKGTLY